MTVIKGAIKRKLRVLADEVVEHEPMKLLSMKQIEYKKTEYLYARQKKGVHSKATHEGEGYISKGPLLTPYWPLPS